MSDSHKRYNAILKVLLQGFGAKGTGHFHSHLNTLALLICGIIGSAHCQLSEIATCSPEKTKLESRVKKFKRWLLNKRSAKRFTGNLLPYSF